MKLLVVRHGETQFNAERRYLGALLLGDVYLRLTIRATQGNPQGGILEAISFSHFSWQDKQSD